MHCQGKKVLIYKHHKKLAPTNTLKRWAGTFVALVFLLSLMGCYHEYSSIWDLFFFFFCFFMTNDQSTLPLLANCAPIIVHNLWMLGEWTLNPELSTGWSSRSILARTRVSVGYRYFIMIKGVMYSWLMKYLHCVGLAPDTSSLAEMLQSPSLTFTCWWSQLYTQLSECTYQLDATATNWDVT